MKPYVINNSRGVNVQGMFNEIAPYYDFLNHLLSLGTDMFWRKKAIKLLKPYKPELILDIATGTGALAIEALSLNPKQITGVDVSQKMINIAKKKIIRKKIENKILFKIAKAEELPFADGAFDIITVAFGVRNFYCLEKGLTEMCRVLKNGGVTAILEFSIPSIIILKHIYLFYFKNILPVIGKIISKNKVAYSYLPETVMNFPQGNEFADILKKTGFKNIRLKRLSLGICTIYLAEK